MSLQVFRNETLEQQGSRHLQALLINPNDGYAFHNMVRCFTSSVKKQPSKCLVICPRLDSAGRSLCAAAVQAQALISADSDEDVLEYGMNSLQRLKAVWHTGYEGPEDVGYWQTYILKPERQLTRVLEAYLRLLRRDPKKLASYSHKLFVDLASFYLPQHIEALTAIRSALTSQQQAAANILLSELDDVIKDLT